MSNRVTSKRKTSAVWALPLACLAFAPHVLAQSPQVPPAPQAALTPQVPQAALTPQAPQAPQIRPVTEQYVVQRAVEHNPELRVALLRAASARNTLRAEAAFYDPLFSANSGITHARSPGLSGNGTSLSTADTIDLGAGLTKVFPTGTALSVDVSGQRSYRVGSQTITSDPTAAPFATSSGPGYSLLGRLSLTQPLLRGFGTDVGLASLRQAKLEVSGQELAAAAQASSLLGSVLRAYWDLWYSSEAIKIDRASRDFALVQQKQADAQVASGALAPADALAYATQVAQLEEALQAAETDQRLKGLALAQWVGDARELGGTLSAADAPIFADPGELDEARITEQALAASYTTKQLETELAIAKDQLKISGDPLRPRLDVDGYVQAQGLGNRSVPPALEQAAKLEAVSAHVGLTFEMPLTDTRRAAQIEASRLALHIAERQLESVQLTLRANVATALSQRQAAAHRVTLATTTVGIAQQQASAERERFVAGSSIALVVQQAEESYRQAQLRLERAKVDLVNAELSLAELRGELLGRYSSLLQDVPYASQQP